MKNSFINITFILLLLQITTSAQFHKKVEIITTDNGLSQNVVKTIVQDSKGFIWFGTNDGLNRYDGYEFQIYKNDFHNNNSLTNNIVECLLEDNQHNLWIGTSGGLSKLNLLKEKFEQNSLPDKLIRTLNNKSVTCLELDLNNDLWIGTNSGLCKLVTKSNEFIDYFESTYPLSELEKKHITALKRTLPAKYGSVLKGNTCTLLIQ